MTDDLVAFLRARYDETAAKARAAKAGPWHADGGSVYATHPTDEVVDYTDSAEHIAHHDPARVLADIDSKRRVLQLVAKAQEEAEFPDHLVRRPARVMLLALEPVLQDLAVAHADHPDYREEWRP